MKISYFSVTLLYLALLIYGAITLIKEVIHKMNGIIPVEISASVITSDVDDATTNNTAEEPQRTQGTDKNPVTNESGAMNESGTSLYSFPQFFDDIGKRREIQQRYTNVIPSYWGEHTPGVVYRVNAPVRNQSRTLFLTINAYSNHQEELTEYLSLNDIKATIFVSGYYVQRNMSVLQRLAQNPLFDIQNLGNRCKSLSVNGASAYNVAGTANIREAVDEVAEGARKIWEVTGKWPAYYRPATGYIDDVATKLIHDFGIKIIGYEVVTDGGGVIGVDAIKENILNAPHGAIIIISINLAYPNIIRGLQAAIDEIKTKELPVHFEQLSDYQQFFATYR